MTFPSGGRGGWVPKSARGKKTLAICVAIGTPFVIALIVTAAVIGGVR